MWGTARSEHSEAEAQLLLIVHCIIVSCTLAAPMVVIMLPVLQFPVSSASRTPYTHGACGRALADVHVCAVSVRVFLLGPLQRDRL
jgi:hypothetical protein